MAADPVDIATTLGTAGDGSNSGRYPVHDDRRVPDPHPEVPHPGDASACGESRYVAALLVVHRVDGVAITGDGPHLDGDSPDAVVSYEIDLPTCDLDITGHDADTQLTQPPGGDDLTGPANPGAVDQSLSSVFSSFSTFTSRNVSTWTFSRNRAGRNMSHTQASLITTSK